MTLVLRPARSPSSSTCASPCLIFLLFNFWQLQINNPEFYNERAEHNRIRSVPTSAARGKIYDREGSVIVDDHSSFKVRLLRDNLDPEHLKPIADGLNLDYDELVAKVKRFSSRPKYDPMPLKQDLTPGEVAFVDSHKGEDAAGARADPRSTASLSARGIARARDRLRRGSDREGIERAGIRRVSAKATSSARQE